FLLRRPPPAPPLLPYTTLFRSGADSTGQRVLRHSRGRARAAAAGASRAAGHGRVPLRVPYAPLRSGVFAALRLPLVRGERVPLRSEEHTSELQSRENLVCRLLL